jgi:phosphoribosylformimino-5-aminoimidazole carboxamide ribotide isomerase
MIEAIPSIDLMFGKCVRLMQGRFDQQTDYPHDPVDLAVYYEKKGFRRLHIVDLQGAKERKLRHLEILSRIRETTSLQIDYGGGIRHKRDVDAVLNAGADFVTIGSLAIRQPETLKRWMAEFDAHKFILAADIRDGKVTEDAWTSGSEFMVDELIRQFLPDGLEQVLCTDISRDGMLEGLDVALYQKLKNSFPEVYIIASGGVTSLDDLRKLDHHHVDAAVIGKAIYEGRIDMDKLKAFVPGKTG